VIADNGGLRDWPTDATVRLLTGQLFFALPEEPQRASTSGREELSGTASTMTEIFGTRAVEPAGLRLIRDRHLKSVAVD
jgi:hypothetical protein